MADEWACDCGYSTSMEPGEKKCPDCGGKLFFLGEYDDDLASLEGEEGEKYDDDDLKTPIDEGEESEEKVQKLDE